MSMSRHDSYEWSKPFGNVRHNWRVICRNGALSFYATVMSKDFTSCEMELHYREPPCSIECGPPSTLNCPITGGWCWHDGTSLYASEHLWPIIKPLCECGNHEEILRILHQEAKQRGLEPTP